MPLSAVDCELALEDLCECSSDWINYTGKKCDKGELRPDILENLELSYFIGLHLCPMFGSPIPTSSAASTSGVGGSGSSLFGHGHRARQGGARKSMGGAFTPFKTPRSHLNRSVRAGGGVSSANTSLAPSQILESCESHSVLASTVSSPVLVTEILTLAEKPTDVSVSLSAEGWAWLVHGRRLVVWRYKVASGQRSLNAACRELTLPASDVAHHARLINVFAWHENQTPSCLAVSPEGLVRFWPNIAHPSSSTEVSADLQGQECHSLTDLQPLGSVLATTTSTIVLVHVLNVGGQHKIVCRQLKPPHGLLGGIGRRVSSLFWGGMPATGEAKLVRVLTSNVKSASSQVTFVLTTMGLQKWILESDTQERLLYEWPVQSQGAETFMKHSMKNEECDIGSLRVCTLDMQFTPKGELAILMAAMNAHSPQQVFYGIGMVDCSTEEQPTEFKNIIAFKPSDGSKDQNITSLGYKLMFPNKKYAYIFNNEGIICVPAQGDGNENDFFDFSTGGNAILGAKSVDGKPYFFAANQGLVHLAVNQNMSVLEPSMTSFNESVSGFDPMTPKKLSESINMSAISQTGLDNLSISESKSDQLKAAFLLFCKRNLTKSASIIESLFPSDNMRSEIDSSVDKLVLSISKDLIDDFPASDPRWMESVPASEATLGQGTMGATMSLLILHQLEDKQTALEFFVSFLKEVGLWNKLCGVTIRETPIPTSLVLCEQVEKTAAAIALRTIHSEHQSLVDKAIERVVRHRKVVLERGLTSQDHFYREISRVHEIFDGLQALQDELLLSQTPREIVNALIAINTIFQRVLKDALQVREKKALEFSPPKSLIEEMEYIPWSSAPGPKGLRTALINQVKISMEKGLSLAENKATRVEIVKQVVHLIDFILDGFLCQLNKTKEARRPVVLKQYEKNRSELISTLVSKGYLEEATSLAEKYLEFVALIKICEITKNRARLDGYMEEFAEHDFSSFHFDWLVREGKQGMLLSQTSSSRHGELGKFLKGHSNISWLHDIQIGDFGKASYTLGNLGKHETDLIARKKTILSLAKLAALASDESDENILKSVNDVEDQLMVLDAQEQLPKSVMDAFKFDSESMHVLAAREIIELYIGDENIQGDHIDFKKALDLLDFVNVVDEEEMTALRLHIWSKAILKDSWVDFDVDNPLEAVKETVCFKLIEFCYIQGADLSTLVPSVEEILSADELSGLAKNRNFQFLLQTGYEHITRVCQEESDKMDS
ncbi:nuclear pore complex protein Nup133-like [Tigriopus californicus]|uniref:nuclear pore complex protein Nup133-like n=1 Tax=Tigriopus californicus TaxID=6832 RepID=UPI0027DA0B49|nr:nuclear pore complex protein Nup133-like [Tigriopus californicus]